MAAVLAGAMWRNPMTSPEIEARSAARPRGRVILALLGLLMLGGSVGCAKSAQQYYDSGNRYANENKLPEAVVEYRNAVQQDPAFAPARLKLGEIAAKGGRPDEALAQYLRAADLLPKDVRVQVQAGSLLLLAKRFDDARSLADKALAVDQRFADAHVLRANAMAGLSDLPGAVAQMQEALAIEGRAGYYANLGALQQAGGQTAEAETAFRKALEVDPKSITAHLAWANFLWATGRAAEVEAALLRGHAVDPANPTANQALATYYLATDRRAEAEPFLRRLATSQRNAAPKLALANFYASMRRNAEAVQVLDEVARQPRHWAEARLLIASIRQGEGRADQARAIVDEVLSKEPGSRAAQLAGARLYVGRAGVRPRKTSMRVGENVLHIQAQQLLGTGARRVGGRPRPRALRGRPRNHHPRGAGADQLACFAASRGLPADEAGQKGRRAVPQRAATTRPGRVGRPSPRLASGRPVDAERGRRARESVAACASGAGPPAWGLRPMQRKSPAGVEALPGRRHKPSVCRSTVPSGWSRCRSPSTSWSRCGHGLRQRAAVDAGGERHTGPGPNGRRPW